MKMRMRCVMFALLLAFALCAAACAGNAQSGSLKICVDGAAYQDVGTTAQAFQEKYPNMQVEVEVLPAVRLDVDENLQPILDTDSQAQREAALQRHRTALMAGSSDADLYLVTGGSSQYHELNGGVLVEDPYDLMTSGVLADLSGALDGIDRAQYMAGTFEAGQSDGAQLLVPLRVTVGGVVASADVVFPARQDEFLELIRTQYASELGPSGLGGLFLLQALSRPVVNKASLTVALYDDDYTAAIDAAQELRGLYEDEPRDSATTAARVGTAALITASSDPQLTGLVLAQELGTQDEPAPLAFVPVPNEKDGVTADVTAYAFTPAGSGDPETAGLFLSFLLSDEVQGGEIPCFSTMGGGYPVRKGCAGADSGCLGESYPDSLRELESRVSDARFFTRYDFELLNLLQANLGSDGLDGALRELYDGWMLYLDE